MTAVKKWISRLTTIVLVLLILLTVFFTLSSLMSSGTPRVFGYQLMTVLSGSMEPGIKTGSVIAIQPITDAERFEAGDVITYQSANDPNTFVTHRIIQVEQDGSDVAYVTQGDNNEVPDVAPVPVANVVGEYTGFTIPYLGYVTTFAKSKLGIVLMMIVPGVYLMISQFINVWRIITESDNQPRDPSTEIKESS